MRPTLGVLSGIALFLALGAGQVAAHEPLECELAVEPAAAPAGRIFVLSGADYRPTELALQKNDGAPVSITLALPDADTFEIPISSQPGDEGLWTATVSDPDAHCSGQVRFRVTLLDTATGGTDGGRMAGAGNGWPAVIYLLVIAGGFTGGTLLARRARAA